MEPTAPMSASPVPAPGHEPAALQARGLPPAPVSAPRWRARGEGRGGRRARAVAAARRRATALLAGVTVLFVAVTAVGTHGVLLGYVQAGAADSLARGVADWFAVTA